MALCLSKRFYFITSFLCLRGFLCSPYITSFAASVLSRPEAKITFFVVKSALSFIRMILMWTDHDARNAGRTTAFLNFNLAEINLRRSPNREKFNYGNVDWP